nr:hypothetical protein [Bacteroides sp.]
MTKTGGVEVVERFLDEWSSVGINVVSDVAHDRTPGKLDDILLDIAHVAGFIDGKIQQVWSYGFDKLVQAPIFPSANFPEGFPSQVEDCAALSCELVRCVRSLRDRHPCVAIYFPPCGGGTEKTLQNVFVRHLPCADNDVIVRHTSLTTDVVNFHALHSTKEIGESVPETV